MADSSVQKDAKVTKMASQSPNAVPSGRSPATSRPAKSSTSKRGIQKLGSWLRKPFSKSKSRAAVQTPTGIGITKEQDPKAIPTTGPDTVSVKMKSTRIKEDTVDPAGYSLAIAVIETFQPAVECTDFVLPTPVGKMLGQLTKVLGILQQMVEKKEAWKEVHKTLFRHAELFNDQLLRMKEHATSPDADSGLLAPLKIYSNALEKLTAKILYESGLVQQDTKGNAGWDKIKKFATTYIDANSERIRDLNKVHKVFEHKEGGSAEKHFKKAITVYSVREGIKDCSRQLEESFQLFMDSITTLIANQTVPLRNDIARMTTVEEEMPSYYQPDSRLHLRLAHGDDNLTVQVIKVFTPFTMAQVILVKCIEENENRVTMVLRLPETFIIKIYDPRFYSDRLPRGTRPARPWTPEAERAAADIRSQQSRARDPDFEPWKRPEDEDNIGWEEWYYQNAEAQYYYEISAYNRLKELQGSLIPHCYASASLQLTDRAISLHVLILEFIPDAVPLDKLDHDALSAPLVRSLLHTTGEFGRLGVIHTDLNPGNILFSPGDRPTRAVIIDFGESGIREDEDDESWAQVVEENADVLWMRKRLDQFFGADFVRELCDSTEIRG